MSDSIYSKMSEASAFNAANSVLSVHNIRSQSDTLYQIKAPFLVTLEYCSGKNPSDYINIITLSANESFIYQDTFDSHHRLFLKYATHIHDYFELMLVLKGSITQKIEGKEYLYHTGTCCLLNRSLAHTEDFHSEAAVLFIGLSLDFVDEIFRSSQTSYFKIEKEILNSEFYDFVQSDLKNPGRKAYLDFIPAYQNQQHPADLHVLAEKLIRALLFPQFGSSYHLKSLICSVLQYLSMPTNYHCTRVTLDSSSDFLLFSRITHLLVERDGRISRAELEKSLNYSGDYLNRIVHKYSGMCLFDYGMTFCLKKAAADLSGTDESIAAIAARLKFSNRTHFYKLFKEHFGMTPKEYRLKHAQTQTSRV